MDPDLKVMPTTGKSFLISETQSQQLSDLKSVASYSKVLEERVLFVFNGKEQVTYLKGVDSSFNDVVTIKKVSVYGQWFKGNTLQAVVGYGIANKLSIGLYDFNNPLEVYVPKPGKGLIEKQEDAFNKSVLIPVGIYAISEDLDSKYVFADLGLTQELLGYKTNQVSALELKLKSGKDEAQAINEVQKIFNNKVTIKNRAQLNDALYKMLNTENIAVYLIFTLVIIIALFNLVGALIMMILDKKGNLKTLYNLGTEINDLRKIFLYQGTLLSCIGGFIGLLLGVIIVLVQQHFKLVMITESLAYPVVFSVQNIVIVLGTIISLGFIASLIASSQVTKKLLE